VLEELDIKNFALIESAHIEFEKGFTVLSGETGAGKSILIGSLAFLLGGKSGTEQIRAGCHEAQVSGVFFLENKETFLWLDEHGIESEENRIIIRRVVRDNGKSSAWIGGTPVTRAVLSEFSAFLVDIHGQHEQQSLMKVAEHRRYLDIYAGIVGEVSSFTSIYNQLVEKRKILENLNSNESERNAKIDMLNFAVSEISDANLKAGEDEELEAEENRLSSFEKLYADIEEINSAFEGEGENGIIFLLKKICGTASKALDSDKSLESLENRLQSAFYEIDDIAGEFRRYASSLVFDPERLEQVQERLELIFRLKQKYTGRNSSVADLLSYAENASRQLEELGGSALDKSALEKEISELEKKVYVLAKSLSEKRKSAAEKMSLDVEKILCSLGMKDTKFRVGLTEKEGNAVLAKAEAELRLAAKAFRVNPDNAKRLDLRNIVNKAFTDHVAGDGKGGWTDQGEKCLRDVPWGLTDCNGVPFDLIRPDQNDSRACLVLGSPVLPDNPREIKGIRVDSAARNLYFLHACAWFAEDVFRYVVHYADGSRVEIPVRNGIEIADWYNMSRKYPGSSLVCGWKNLEGRGLWLYQWKNPHPEKQIATIDIVSSWTRSVGIVAAITVEPPSHKSELNFTAENCSLHAWGLAEGALKQQTLELNAAGKARNWSGCSWSWKKPFGLSEPMKSGSLLFEINGGNDAWGKPRGTQQVQIKLLALDDSGKELRFPYLPIPVRIDSDPGTWQPVAIPLRRLLPQKTAKLKGISLQFQIQPVEQSGIAIRALRIRNAAGKP